LQNAWLEKTLNEFTQEIRQLLSDELVAVILYGSGAGANFVPDRSDINIVIVVKSAHFDILQKLQPHLGAWRKRGFAMPLLLDQEFLQRARDVFPMEFHDIREQHRLLWGEDVFQDFAIDPRHLRFQAEHEARSKLLRLRAVYLECAEDPTRLRALLIDSSKTFLILLRNLIRLHGHAGVLSYEEVLSRSERQFQLTFPLLRQLLTIRTGQQPWPATPLAHLFRDYLAEVQQIIGVIDHLPPNLSAAHA
jgi:predicted nucleotidyltransferase